MIKIFGEASNEISSLDLGFQPIANHLISFLEYYCKTNNQYSYEVISTSRSWYTQKKVTTNPVDARNGHSWYLYGKAISINIYKNIEDSISTDYSETDYIRNTINIKDGSSTEVMTACQEWFINNTLNGNIVKIYGLYPNIKTTIKFSNSELMAIHKDDPYVIYWGGLFSSGPNYTHFEWHPGYAPNEVYLMRDMYLNNIYGENDVVSILDEEIPDDQLQYTSDELEILEEDLVAVWKLKCEISNNRSYNIIQLIDWAKKNPKSLSMASKYYYMLGDYNNRSLFNILLNDVATIGYDYPSNLLSINGSDLKVQYDKYGNYTINFYNEFEELIKIGSSNEYIVPLDNAYDNEDFNIDLNLTNNSNGKMYNSTLTSETEEGIFSEIALTSKVVVNPKFEVNEHGMLNDITISPLRMMDQKDTIKLINNSMIFEEMITPPNMKNIKKSTKKILDISKISTNINTSNYSEEMINPPTP